MTTGKNPFDDAEFEAFLSGEGDLAQQLRTLPQPEPSAELDAAIFAAIEIDMLKSAATPAAANDAQIPNSGNVRSSTWMRWGAPIATAASVVFAVILLKPQMEHDNEPLEVAQAPAAAAAPQEVSRVEKEGRPLPSKKSDSTASHTDAKSAALNEAALSKAKEAPKREALPTAKPASPVVLAESDQARLAVSAPSSSLHQSPSASAAAPSFAGKLALERDARAVTDTEVKEVASQAAVTPPKIMAAPPLAAVAASASESAPAARSRITYVAGASGMAVGGWRMIDEPKSWLGLIEELLKADATERALVEWDKFRKSYPDYPVPEQLEARLKALKK